MNHKICVFSGDALAKYNFGEDHPFGPFRLKSFLREMEIRKLTSKLTICNPVMANEESIALFHTIEYLNQVKAQSKFGTGFLDYGDTPAFIGVYEAAATVVGTTLAGIDKVMSGECYRAFIPIAGLHHARRDKAAGFCVFNDCGVAIEYLRRHYGLQRIAYVDIDAHHGDGVYYSFQSDPYLILADVHEDGRYLYPGSGKLEENGIGIARGTKLNLPVPPGADDGKFFTIWEQVEDFVRNSNPEFILFQCGADSLAGDPITHLEYSEAAHRHAAKQLCTLADGVCGGRIVAMGGGGYNLNNIAKAWCAVLEEFLCFENKPVQ